MWSTSDITSLSLQVHQQTQNITEILLWNKCQNSYLREIKILSNTAPNMYRYKFKAELGVQKQLCFCQNFKGV